MNADTVETLSPWESNDGGELTQEKRHLSHGTATVMMCSDAKAWMWWVDTPGLYSSASGVEATRARARYRAMLVYLTLTREAST